MTALERIQSFKKRNYQDLEEIEFLLQAFEVMREIAISNLAFTSTDWRPDIDLEKIAEKEVNKELEKRMAKKISVDNQNMK